jgi:hypothetical protein
MSDLPFDVDAPAEVAYGDIGQPYDEDNDWRDTQARWVQQQFGESHDEEATDG